MLAMGEGVGESATGRKRRMRGPVGAPAADYGRRRYPKTMTDPVNEEVLLTLRETSVAFADAGRRLTPVLVRASLKIRANRGAET